ncbi:MAG: hypothetical protein R2734_18705 [Nocardioides sp.]
MLAGSGVIRPYAPWRLARLGVSVARWGVGLAGVSSPPPCASRIASGSSTTPAT